MSSIVRILFMPITIAIDGYAGCGKSTTAKRVAQSLGYLFIDSGAMYRAVTLHALRQHIPFEEDNQQLQAALKQLTLTFTSGENPLIPSIVMNGESVEREIRTPDVAASVSQVARLGSVRDTMVAQQRQLAANGGVVMDGRDIGTVVFPHAELKIFMKADPIERARRRLAELENKGLSSSLEDVLANLQERDRIDTTRAIAPLKQADDAIVIDTTHLTIDEQVNRVLALANQRIKGS